MNCSKEKERRGPARSSSSRLRTRLRENFVFCIRAIRPKGGARFGVGFRVLLIQACLRKARLIENFPLAVDGVAYAKWKSVRR
jgi:hypothetical protein